MKTAVVIIPTYNEADTLPRMLEHLLTKTFPSIDDWFLYVLVVDGNSPDGTAEAVQAYTAEYPAAHLLVEQKKEGIGAAYFKGFDYAINNLGADVLIEFDGDFQHPPETIPLLLEKIEEGADLVLGSRRVKGGSYPRQWGLKRLFFSRIGGALARYIMFFPLKSFFWVTDPTTGLKATKVGDYYRSLDFSRFLSRGFGYKVEMLYKLVKGGARVEEIPLQFGIRDAGESKITSQTPAEILLTVLKLRLTDEATRRFIKFGLVGFSGYLVNALCLELFANLQLTQIPAAFFGAFDLPDALSLLTVSSSWAAALAAEVSIINNFIWNNSWTFKSRKARDSAHLVRRFFGFNFTSLGAIVLQFLGIGVATALLGETTLVRQLSLIATVALLVVPYNWLMYNRVIWRKKRSRS